MTNKQQNEMEMRHWNLIDRLKCQLKNNKKIGRICSYYSTPIKHLHKYQFKKNKNKNYANTFSSSSSSSITSNSRPY